MNHILTHFNYIVMNHLFMQKKVRKNLIKLEKTLSYDDNENKNYKIHQLVKK